MEPGEVISYLEMCRTEGANIQRGMNFRHGGTYSVILMSRRPNAPYVDQVEEDGEVLIYEGHDAQHTQGGPDPKRLDQPMEYESGKLTQNGLFYQAAQKYKDGQAAPQVVKAYEKLYPGIWVYNGMFKLLDAWQERVGGRDVFKFRLAMTAESSELVERYNELAQTRIIPTSVKLEVWKRDKGRCVICGSTDNLHFDHIIPYSKGGSSLVAANIQLLCARHNIAKRDKIQ